MGQCKQPTDTKAEITTEPKPNEEPIKVELDPEKEKQLIEEKTIAIQAAFRKVKAKEVANQERELAKQDQPKEGERYNGDFVIPELPQLFKDKVDKSVTNLNRMLPAFKLPDGSIYQGQWSKGLQSGYGMMTKKDGTFLEGQWKEGKMIEGGILFSNKDIYVGTDQDGIMQYSSGTRYEGKFKDNHPNGIGKETLKDGSFYEGEFKDGKRHGQGVYKQQDGSWFQGSYVDGEIKGHGKYHWPDKSEYEGQWDKNLMNGQGKITFPDGSHYIGNFKDGLKDGYGKIVYKDGTYYEGQFNQNQRHGKGKIVRANHETIECEYVRGQLQS